MNEIVKISDSELVLMRIIWRNGGIALFAEIIDALEQRKAGWKSNTVLTLLSRLVDKGFLSISKIGRRNEYRTLISEAEYRTAKTKEFVDKIYKGNVKQFICTLQGLMSAEEQEELKKLLKVNGSG